MSTEGRSSAWCNGITITVAAVVIYGLSYLGARQFLGLRIHTGKLDTGGVTFRSFLPDAALEGLNLFYLPLRQADAKWTGAEVRFERIRHVLDSGTTLEL